MIGVNTGGGSKGGHFAKLKWFFIAKITILEALNLRGAMAPLPSISSTYGCEPEQASLNIKCKTHVWMCVTDLI